MPRTDSPLTHFTSPRGEKCRLAVEIISPSDNAEGVARKVRQYVAAGSRAVWTVYPKACEIHRFSPDATVRIVSTDALLEDPGLFPGWSLSLSELF